MTEEEKRAAIKDFALTKGLAVALLAGVMSACFALASTPGPRSKPRPRRRASTRSTQGFRSSCSSRWAVS